MGIYDIGIIGGGTAGMTAAIYGQRAGKQTVLFEGTTFGGQITSSPNVENYPGIASVSGSEFSMNLMDQAVKLGTQTIMEQVTGIREEADYKVIVTTEKEYECKSIILATGVTHRHLGVPGEERLTGAGVSYCATCDGMFFRGREVAVVGGGSTALQDAEFLSNYCSKVYLIHRRDEFRGEDQIVKRLQEKENVEFILNTTVQEIRGEQMVESLRVLNKVTGEESELAVSGIFVAVGQIAQNEKFADVVQLDESGFIVAGEDCKTSEAGIYAAGDCRTVSILLVECRRKARCTSSCGMPQPLSVIRMKEIPPSLISIFTEVDPASIAFSTSSFTIEAGRSITSPAAILSIVIWSNT